MKAEVGKYYVVKFNTKKTQVFYVGQILSLGPDNEVEVNFYRKSSDGVFRLPTTVDQVFVSVDQWCSTGGPRAVSGPPGIFLWPSNYWHKIKKKWRITMANKHCVSECTELECPADAS